jgi:hypothetical protein
VVFFFKKKKKQKFDGTLSHRPRAVFRPNIQKQSLKNSSDGTGVRLTTTRIDSRSPPNGLCDDKLDETLVSFR